MWTTHVTRPHHRDYYQEYSPKVHQPRRLVLNPPLNETSRDGSRDRHKIKSMWPHVTQTGPRSTWHHVTTAIHEHFKNMWPPVRWSSQVTKSGDQQSSDKTSDQSGDHSQEIKTKLIKCDSKWSADHSTSSTEETWSLSQVITCEYRISQIR